MQIVDLSYLEKAHESDLILGFAGVMVTASALATGTSPNQAFVFTDTFARALKNGGVIAIGRGVAIATGSNAQASVTVAGEGDLVIAINGSRYLVSKNTAIAAGIVVAIDLPA